MSVWTVKEQTFANTAANTYQYTGVAITVPAYQMYEIIAIDRVGTTRPLGIIVSDNNTDITTVSAIIAENEDVSTGAMPWAKQLHCMTPSIKTVEHTFYVWVKRETTGSNAIVIAYRRIV